MTTALDEGLCSLPPNAGSLRCFLAEVKAKRSRAESIDSEDVSTACCSPVLAPQPDPTEDLLEGSWFFPQEWTKARVLALCGELLQGFQVADFQAKLKPLLAKAPAAACSLGRMELALTVQSVVLPKYGFDGTYEGVQSMLEMISPFLVDREVHDIINAIDETLGLPANTTSKAASGPYADESGKEACLKCNGTGSLDLTRAQVLALSAELLEGFRAPLFQEVLLAVDQGGTPMSVMNERMQLAMAVQSKVLPKYGLPGDHEGVLLLMEAYTQYEGDCMVSDIVDRINESLGQLGGR